jgi:3-methyladenine DNA glycosylase AlkC
MAEAVAIKRKGAARRADIPPDVLAALNAGTIESASLSESLAIDFAALMAAIAPQLATAAREKLLPENPFTKRLRVAGELLCAEFGMRGYKRFATHASDTVRGWAAYQLSAAPRLTLAKRIEHVRVLADDSHFGVRETAWLALRPHLLSDLDGALASLTPWTLEASENLRRFAVESLRPRGVWCAHIEAFKQEPELGLQLLEPLKSDPARYVQNSVANWLNDAGKTQPQWVKTLCKRWRKESKSPETTYICQRALRNLA